MSGQTTHTALGWWHPNGNQPATDAMTVQEALYHLARPVYLLERDGQYIVGTDGYAVLGNRQPAPDVLPLVGYAPVCQLNHLGDPTFCADYHLQYPYLTGSMANGIASAEIVEAMGQHGMLGFFGAGGLALTAVETAIHRISNNLGAKPYGFNLLHSPNEPNLEAAIVDLYLQRGVHLIEASAYLTLTLPVVRYRVSGIHRNASGQIVTPNRIIAKVSRVEVATQFFAPPPEPFLRQLVNDGEITAEQARLAEQIPVAQDVTAEADSGGHTDSRPAIALIPTILALRDQMQAKYHYAQRLRVGAAGGIATPASAAAAFAMGAAYILTGSVNQACVESGTSDVVRQMLAETQQADVTMAPAADMFEMGVKVQVLKRGTMFAMRAAKLYDLYRTYSCIEDLPLIEKETLEKKFFHHPLETIWSQTQHYFSERDPAQIERAERDPKYKMALIFRWYLGQSSRWANTGNPDRKIDYQIWCGPAMSAFNAWVKGSFLEHLEHRRVVTVAFNLLYGAGVLTRVNALRLQGIQLAPAFLTLSPLTVEELQKRM